VIEGYIGLIGAGKTMLAVEHCISTAVRRRALLFSNIAVTTDRLAPEDVVQLATGDDGLDVDELRGILDRARAEGRGAVLLLDEVGILMPARFWQSFPVDLMFQFSQSRKLGLDVVYTAQDIEQVDSFLRRLTQWVFKVRAFPTPSVERRERGRRPRLFIVTKWRPASVDKRDKRLGRAIVRYRRSWEAQYNTDELVRPAERLRRRRGAGSAAAGAPDPRSWLDGAPMAPGLALSGSRARSGGANP